MDAQDVPPVIADALNSLERRIGNAMAEIKAAMADMKAGLKHDLHLLSVKMDVNHKRTHEKLDRGFQQVMERLEKR